MITTRNLLTVALGLAVATFAGCDKTYTLKFTNVTSEPIDVVVLESGQFTEVEAYVAADGGKSVATITQKEDESQSYIVKAGKMKSQPFDLNKGSANPMYFHITPDGIIGPVDRDQKVKTKWENKADVKIDLGEKVE